MASPYAQGQNASPVAAKETALESISTRLDGLHTEASLLADRISRVLIRAFGEAAEDGKALPKAVPSGTVGQISERLSDINDALGRVAQFVNRLDELV